MKWFEGKCKKGINMKQAQDLLFMTYQLKHNEHELDVSYYGCREIVIPEYKRPSYIRGMIEFEGNYIPVIDPNIYYRNQPTHLTNLACILVIEHVHECRNHQTGIILEDIKEIMNLVTGNYNNKALKTLPFNIRFILKVLKRADVYELLSDTHMSINLREQQKQANADFITFSEIVERELVHA
jgi:chemotaxis signal transduction protein